ncbi:hypothetical protein [Azospirillum ramasamyi]|uniref:hypothetical protein n=1 Tax=Azospirillum ramasamyi TaxID=682998 RepID=UPI0013A6C5B9|nr:hypothetical protein [Azospirillum ramasamyi]
MRDPGAPPEIGKDRRSKRQKALPQQGLAARAWIGGKIGKSLAPTTIFYTVCSGLEDTKIGKP